MATVKEHLDAAAAVAGYSVTGSLSDCATFISNVEAAILLAVSTGAHGQASMSLPVYLWENRLKDAKQWYALHSAYAGGDGGAGRVVHLRPGCFA